MERITFDDTDAAVEFGTHTGPSRFSFEFSTGRPRRATRDSSGRRRQLRRRSWFVDMRTM